MSAESLSEFVRSSGPAVVAAVVVYALMAAAMFWFRTYQKQKKQADEFRAELSEMRELLESQIYESTGKLMRLPSRWRDVNHLLLSASKLELGSSNEALVEDFPLYVSNGISSKEIKSDDRLVFVLMPFHSSFKEYFRTVRGVCASLELKCIRGDEEYRTAEVFRDILVHIARAKIIIANIDGRNPNVFYELGIAHALGKHVLMTTQNIANAPFDIRSKRVLVYKDSKDLARALRKQLSLLTDEQKKA